MKRGMEGGASTQGAATKRRAIPALPTRPSCAASLSLPRESFDAVCREFVERQGRRDAIQASVKGVFKDCDRAIQDMMRGETAGPGDLINGVMLKAKEGVSHVKSEEERGGSLAGAIEACVRARAMQNFFETGTLLTMSQVEFANRQEYLAGIMGFCGELQRYAVLRAIDRDVTSLRISKRLVDAANAELMQFDWKNGPLRHKYDSIKYVVRQFEDKLFELSLQEAEAGADAAGVGLDVVGDEGIVNSAEFAELRKQMEEYDDMRENVIKQCRDLQKGSKNSIYQLHRGDISKAKAELAKVQKQAMTLLPLVQQHETLRSGSYSSALEEYAEAMLFMVFLEEGRVASMEELAPINAVEYVGGLLDLTGEVGRHAVKQATARKIEDVQKCQVVIDRVMFEFMGAVGLPGGVSKKLDQCKQTLRKMDNILYELSLSRKSAAVGGDVGGGGDA